MNCVELAVCAHASHIISQTRTTIAATAVVVIISDFVAALIQVDKLVSDAIAARNTDHRASTGSEGASDGILGGRRGVGGGERRA